MTGMTAKQQDWSMVAAFVAVVIIISLIVDGGGHGSSGPDGITRDAIYGTCHISVKNYLSAPATANFHDEAISHSDHGGWTLTGQVDSQNAFGATLTSSFSCDTDARGYVFREPIVTNGL